MILKSKDFQNLVLSKYENDEGLIKLFRDINGFVGLWPIGRWRKAVRDTDSIKLSSPPDRHRTIQTQETIQ